MLYKTSNEYAKIPLNIGIVVAIVAVVFYALQMTVAGILAMVGVVGCGVAWLCCLWYAAAWKKRLVKMEQGEFYAYWLIEESAWHVLLDAERRKTNLILWMVPPVCTVPLIGVACAMYEGGDLILGSVFLTFAIPPLAALAVAGAICAYIHWTIGERRRRLRNMQGECYLGHNGVYVTGTYLPYSSFGYGLVDAAVSFKGLRDGELVLTFRSQTKHGHVDNDTRIPVPRDQRSAVEQFVQKFKKSGAM